MHTKKVDEKMKKKTATSGASSTSTSTSSEKEKEEDARIAQKYNVPHEIEHILKQSDMYIGDDMKPSTVYRWLPESEDMATTKMVYRPCTMVHGVMKLIDELVVNASDQVARTAQAIQAAAATKTTTSCCVRPVRNIYVSVDEATGAVEVLNDGTGIEVVMHPTENKWVPEVVFTTLRAGENGDKSEQSTTGGKNGHGAKLAIIWSTASTVETVDDTRQLRYLQHIGANMFVVHPPEVSKVPKTQKPFTRVRIVPDYARANMPLGVHTPDFLALIRARVLCLAAVVSGRKHFQAKVYFNGALVPITGMADFVARFPLPRPPCCVEADDADDAAAADNDTNDDDDESPPPPPLSGVKRKLPQQQVEEQAEKEEVDAGSVVTAKSATSGSTRSSSSSGSSSTGIKKKSPLPAWIQCASPSPRWEVFVGYSSSGKKEHVSFVNGVCTYQGGTHVAHIVDQITARAVARIAAVHKITLKPAAVSSLLQVFVRADIAVPKFSGQAKESLRTAADAFGGTCKLTNAWIDRLVAALGIGQIAVARETALDAKQLKKDLSAITGSGGGSGGGGGAIAARKYQLAMQAVDKYHAAPAAGRYVGSSAAKRAQTELMLTEGDSAKAGVCSGIPANQAEYIGVYPLSGVPTNALTTSLKALVAKSLAKSSGSSSSGSSAASSPLAAGTTKIDALLTVMRILGLEAGMVFTDMASVVRQLHYAHVYLVADQDHDGSHIKGLVLLFFHTNWPSLLRVPGFLRVFNTPVVVVRRQKDGAVLARFTSQTAFQRWKLTSSVASRVKWVAKYYKGLGTSTAAEWKYYMANRNEFTFTHTGAETDELMSICFDPKRIEDRKRYLTALALGPEEARELEPGEDGSVSVENFLRDMLRTYSNYSILRALPHVVDGFKPSMRKVWFAARLRGLTQDVKVVQFAGFISEKADYHHGETSMQDTIIGMAQRIPGQNNIALLYPSGQFGTRLMNGGDAASPRYTFTRMAEIACALFRPEDDCVLPGLPSDGEGAGGKAGTIEPAHYVPILPMVLINPCGGIATGWSHTSVVYHPAQIADYIRVHFLQAEPTLAHLYSGLHRGGALPDDADDLVPYHEGFRGTICPVEGAKTVFVMRGVYTAELVVPNVVGIENDGDTNSNTKDSTKDKTDNDGGQQQPYLRVVVTEVPVEKSYQQYKTMLLDLQRTSSMSEEAAGKTQGEWVLRLVSATTTNTTCRFEVEIECRKKGGGFAQLKQLLTATKAAKATKGTLLRFTPDLCPLEKFLGLATIVRTTNMSLIEDPVDPVTKQYSEHAVVLPRVHLGPSTVLARHCEERMATYVRRHASHLASLRRRLVTEENMARFLEAVHSGELVFHRLSRAQMIALLAEHGYAAAADTKEQEDDDDDDKDAGENQASSTTTAAAAKNYDYLLSVRMHQCSLENVAKRTRAAAELRAEVEAYALETPRSLWLKELAEFDVAYQAYLGELEADLLEEQQQQQEEKADEGTKTKTTEAKKKPAVAAAAGNNKGIRKRPAATSTNETTANNNKKPKVAAVAAKTPRTKK